MKNLGPLYSLQRLLLCAFILIATFACGDRQINQDLLNGENPIADEKPLPNGTLNTDDFITANINISSSLFSGTVETYDFLDIWIVRFGHTNKSLASEIIGNKTTILNLSDGSVSTHLPHQGEINCAEPYVMAKKCNELSLTIKNFFGPEFPDKGRDLKMKIFNHGEWLAFFSERPELDVGKIQIIEYQIQIGSELNRYFSYRWSVKGHHGSWLNTFASDLVGSSFNFARREYRKHNLERRMPILIGGTSLHLFSRVFYDEPSLVQLEHYLIQHESSTRPLPLHFIHEEKELSLALRPLVNHAEE